MENTRNSMENDDIIKIEHFFYDIDFYNDLEDFTEEFEISEHSVLKLPDDWQVEVELATLQPVFDLSAKSLSMILEDYHEYDFNKNEKGQVIAAIKASIDFDKLKKLLPKQYFSSGVVKVITKSDLIRWADLDNDLNKEKS